MAHSQFSLSWDAHKKNICNGLSSLQQNGEFVDMTLAADGHMVKVHQVIMALASPYIKEIISSAPCQHPVIFLNKISYATLSSILEYIYTGEVVVSIENLDYLIEAGKELHIRGLEDMKIHESIARRQQQQQQQHQEDLTSTMDEEMLDEEYCYFEVTDMNGEGKGTTTIYPNEEYILPKSEIITDKLQETFDETIQEETKIDAEVDSESNLMILQDVPESTEHRQTIRIASNLQQKIDLGTNMSVMQYTVSNQGSLQMILNRFIYYLKHTNRDSSRQWRCVDYLNSNKCPAHVVTKEDVVLQRIFSHNHSFHDKRILKKLKDHAVFSAIQQAEAEGQQHKNAKQSDSIKESS